MMTTEDSIKVLKQLKRQVRDGNIHLALNQALSALAWKAASLKD